MAIKVYFSENQRDVTVGGLYQWDFGQVLEIECPELGSEIMEVHFASTGMNEAIVRSCSFAVGIGTVTIPDQCLEQASPITAWIYSVSGTQGHTVKTITLPITARTRPSTSREVPQEYLNLYGEALAEINEAVNKLENGEIIATQATHAVSADNATTATNAVSASYATSAGSAQSANNATYALRLSISEDSPIIDVEISEGTALISDDIGRGIYLAMLTLDHNGTCHYSGVGYIGADKGTSDDVAVNYKIALGEVYVSLSRYKSYIDININKDGDTAADQGSRQGTLKLYRIALFSTKG